MDQKPIATPLKSKIPPIAILVALNIILPTFDAYGDMAFTISAFYSGYIQFGLAMFIPVLVNSLFQCVAFAQVEEDKKYTWPLVPLQLWPQYRAIKVIRVMWNDLVEGKKEKEKFKNNVSTLEPVLESMPQAIIKLYIWFTISGSRYDPVSCLI